MPSRKHHDASDTTRPTIAIRTIRTAIWAGPICGCCGVVAYDNSVKTAILGVPVLYAYIFAAWALLIALVALVVERRG